MKESTLRCMGRHCHRREKEATWGGGSRVIMVCLELTLF